MERESLHQWSQEVARENEFKIEELIYESEAITKGNLRNVIYSGFYKGNPTVLKVYDEYRITDEPLAQETFLRKNKSKKLTAPKLYKYKILSPHRGWLIMEKIPQEGFIFKSPLSPDKRAKFLELFLEYKRNFPKKSTRELTIKERLPAADYHMYRISRWLEMASQKENELVLNKKETFLDLKEFVPLYLKTTEKIRKWFKDQKNEWIHGHFKPKELCRHSSGKTYYLTDFAHVKMYPKGYELAFIIWSDYLMASDWALNYADWRKGIDIWIEELRPIAKELKISNYDNLIRSSLLERVLGTILGDITANDLPSQKKKQGLAKMFKLIKELI